MPVSPVYIFKPEQSRQYFEVVDGMLPDNVKHAFSGRITGTMTLAKDNSTVYYVTAQVADIYKMLEDYHDAYVLPSEIPLTTKEFTVSVDGNTIFTGGSLSQMKLGKDNKRPRINGKKKRRKK